MWYYSLHNHEHLQRALVMELAKLSLLGLAAVWALPVFAQSAVIADAIKLSHAGLGEEVMIAWAEKQESGALSAADIVQLKEAKVPDRAIMALIRSGAKSTPAGNPMMVQKPRETVTYAARSSTLYIQPSNNG